MRVNAHDASMFRGPDVAGARAYRSLQEYFVVASPRPRKARAIGKAFGPGRGRPSLFRIGDAGGHVGNAETGIGQTMTPHRV